MHNEHARKQNGNTVIYNFASWRVVGRHYWLTYYLKLSNDGDSADLQTKAQSVLMTYFKITRDNTHYRYQTYRYDRFDYAVAYAKQDMKKQEQKNDLSIEPSSSR